VLREYPQRTALRGESLSTKAYSRAAAAQGPAASEEDIYRALAPNDEVENFCWPG